MTDRKIDSKPIVKNIEDILIKTILSIEDILFKSNVEATASYRKCFEFLGFDILLDVNLKPWLLEVNLSPSLSCEASIDFNIKTQLVSDLFNLVGIHSNDKLSSNSKKQNADSSLEEMESSFEHHINLMELENKRLVEYKRACIIYYHQA